MCPLLLTVISRQRLQSMKLSEGILHHPLPVPLSDEGVCFEPTANKMTFQVWELKPLLALQSKTWVFRLKQIHRRQWQILLSCILFLSSSSQKKVYILQLTAVRCSCQNIYTLKAGNRSFQPHSITMHSTGFFSKFWCKPKTKGEKEQQYDAPGSLIMLQVILKFSHFYCIF